MHVCIGLQGGLELNANVVIEPPPPWFLLALLLQLDSSWPGDLAYALPSSHSCYCCWYCIVLVLQALGVLKALVTATDLVRTAVVGGGSEGEK